MRTWFGFGEQRAEYALPVFNERAVRAAAGLLFVPALVSFMHALLLGNFFPTRVFILVFVLDMALRLLVNPRWSPSLVLGQWVVRHQRPEWTGAPQKRFAWGLGLALGLLMLWLMVFNRAVGPVNMLVCSTCLLLMFFETAFGICLGCKLHGWLLRETPQLCPGESCDLDAERGAAPAASQWLALLLASAVAAAGVGVLRQQPDAMHELGVPPAAVLPNAAQTAEPAGSTASAPALAEAEARRCQVPQFAKAMGHEAIWKQHNHCPP